MSTTTIEPVGLEQLARDVRNAAVTLDVRQARYLVDLYYTMQEHRIALAGQSRAMDTTEEPHEAISFFSRQMATLEKQVQSVLDYWSARQSLGEWARSQKGIGPVLASGLLAHIDVVRAETASHVWRFAGLDPTVKWGKGEKRPYNADLKLLCWKIGDSFMKVSGSDDAFYGVVYRNRKAYEIERNARVVELPAVEVTDPATEEVVVAIDGELVTAYRIADRWFAGGNAKAAHDALAKKIGKDTNAYKAYAMGQIPDAQILARAKRYAVKLFLAHYVEVGRRQLGLEVALPYPIAHMNHTEHVPPPDGA